MRVHRTASWVVCAVGAFSGVGCAAADTGRDSLIVKDTRSVDVTPSPRPENVKRLDAMKPDGDDLGDLAHAIRASNDDCAQRLAAEKLIAFAKTIAAPSWRDDHRAALRTVDRPLAEGASSADFDAALAAWQTETMTPVFAAMDALGGDRIVDFAMKVASSRDLPVEQRLLGVAVALHNVDRNDKLEVARLETIIGDLDALVAQADGGRSARDAIVRTLEAMADDVRVCADAAAHRDAHLAEDGMLELVVAKDGTVSEARVEGLASQPLTTCLTAASKKLRFSMPPSGDGFRIRVPMTFRASLTPGSE